MSSLRGRVVMRTVGAMRQIEYRVSGMGRSNVCLASVLVPAGLSAKELEPHVMGVIAKGQDAILREAGGVNQNRRSN